MKIDYAIVSSNNDKFYLDFWKPVSRVWFYHINIKPFLVFISTRNKVTEKDHCIIHEIKEAKGIPSGFQAQVSRLYVPSLYPNKSFVTSDIDTLPISKEYFHSTVSSAPDDSLVIFNAASYPDQARYPICFNAAKGQTFNDILDLDCEFEEFCSRLINLNLDPSGGRKGIPNWNTDELYFGKKVEEFCEKNGERVIKVPKKTIYEGPTGKLIDRYTDDKQAPYDDELVLKGHYRCAHLLRPKNYQTDRLVNLLLNNFKKQEERG